MKNKRFIVFNHTNIKVWDVRQEGEIEGIEYVLLAASS